MAEEKLSKDEITNVVLTHLDQHYEIYGIEGTGELTIYNYPYSDGLTDGFIEEIFSEHGFFLRGQQGLKKISRIMHESFLMLFPDRTLSRNWESDIINLLRYRRTVNINEFDTLISGKETLLFKNGKILVKFPLGNLTPYFPSNNNAYKSFQQLPVKYDPKAECPKIDAFLKETFGEERFNFILEIIGYLMSRKIEHQKAFVLYGVALTGKTTFIELLTRFIGKSLISNISLHGLGERFALARTRDKRVNIHDDLSFAKIYNNSYSNFKQLVTNKSLSGEMKNIQALVEWDNTCKCVFGCNQLPFLPFYADNDFFRRLILVPCKNVVRKKNKNLLAELITEEELSGLLNRALKGLAILTSEGGFPEEWDNIELVQQIWELNSKPSKMFIEEECVFGEDVQIEVDTFNTILQKFRNDNKAIKVSPRQIATSMKLYKNSYKLIRKQRNGIKYRIYEGLDISPESDYFKHKDDLTMDHLELQKEPISIQKVLTGG